MTADDYHQRTKDAKALAVETQDLWERELLFKIAAANGSSCRRTEQRRSSKLPPSSWWLGSLVPIAVPDKPIREGIELLGMPRQVQRAKRDAQDDTTSRT